MSCCSREDTSRASILSFSEPLTREWLDLHLCFLEVFVLFGFTICTATGIRRTNKLVHTSDWQMIDDPSPLGDLHISGKICAV